MLSRRELLLGSLALPLLKLPHLNPRYDNDRLTFYDWPQRVEKFMVEYLHGYNFVAANSRCKAGDVVGFVPHGSMTLRRAEVPLVFVPEMLKQHWDDKDEAWLDSYFLRPTAVELCQHIMDDIREKNWQAKNIVTMCVDPIVRNTSRHYVQHRIGRDISLTWYMYLDEQKNWPVQTIPHHTQRVALLFGTV